MAKSFNQYPALTSALKTLATDSGLEFRKGWEEIVPPARMEKQLENAEEAAAYIRHLEVKDLIDIEGVEDLVSANDNCLETVACGERTAADLITAKLQHGAALDDILESAFEGELYGLLFCAGR